MTIISQIVNSESSISTLLQELDDSVIYKDKNGIYLDCNSRFINLLNKEKSEIIGKTDYFLFDRNIADEIRSRELDAQHSGTKIEYEHWFSRQDNKTRLLKVKVIPLYDNENEFTGVLSIIRDITLDSRFQNFLNQSKEALLVVKSDQVLYSNNHFNNLIGFEKSDLENISLEKIFEVGGYQRLKELRIGSLNLKIIDKHFKRIDVRIEKDIMIEGNSLIEIYTVKKSHDIANFLTDSDQKSILIENSPIPILLINYEGQISTANNFAKVIFESDLIGERIDKFIPNLQSVDLKNIKDNELKSFEIETRKSVYLFFLRSISSKGSLGLYGIDITQRYIYNRKISLQNKILEIATDGIVITDVEGKIIWSNPAITALTGYSLQELMGKTPGIFKSGEHPQLFYKKMWETILRGHIWSGRLINKKKDGSLVHESMTITPVKNSKGLITHFISIKRDISQFIKAEQYLKNQSETLEKLVKQRTEELQLTNTELLTAKEFAEKSDQLKSEFLAQISHEIRTPVNAILSFSSMLELHLEEQIDEELEFSFQMIKNGGERLIRTIDLILNKSELQLGTYKSNFKIQNLIDEVVKPLISEYNPLAKRRSLTLDLEDNLGENNETYFDKFSIWHVISNLIDNSIKYTNEGLITVKVGRNSEGAIELDVVDTGIGISEEFLPTIFEPFSQEQSGYTRKFEGNGLGLSLVKDYCELNNCKIKIESEKDVGSTFKIIFPQMN